MRQQTVAQKAEAYLDCLVSQSPLEWSVALKTIAKLAFEHGYREAQDDAYLAIGRLRGLIDALDPSYTDETIIRCEVTAADLRALKGVLENG